MDSSAWPGLSPSPVAGWHVAVLPSVPAATDGCELGSGALGSAGIRLMVMSPATDVAHVTSVFLLDTSSPIFSSPHH